MSHSAVALASFALWILTLVAEAVIGISWDFHPDAGRYLTEYEAVLAHGIRALPNNLYYFISGILHGEGVALVMFNGALYVTTNVMLWNAYRVAGIIEGRAVLPGLVLVFADGYRLHLAVHPLKDTLVVFLAVAVLVAKRGRLLALVFLLLSRLGAILYLIAALPRRWVLLLGLSGLVVVVFGPEETQLLLMRDTDMGGRAFDTVPSFVDQGTAGALLRATIWPVILVSGAFVLLSPSLLFAPLAAYLIGQRLVAIGTLRSVGLPTGLLLALAVLASLVTTFTSYLRYTLPIMTLSILLACWTGSRPVRGHRNAAVGTTAP